ncbi:MAG: TIGR03087 family PEP-CTERM/XrtA system glycosyltransferase [Kiloniellaceae bacterium]
MKILYVCHRFPFPPNRGGKIRPFNMIKHLSDRHEVTVASLARSAEEARAGEGIAPHCHTYLMETVSAPGAMVRMVLGAPTPKPASMAYFYAPTLKRRIREEIERTAFDLIFVHCSSVAQYVEDVTSVPKILDFGDMDSHKWLDYARVRRFPVSLVYLLEGAKLRRAEVRLARRFDYCTCTTRAEFETLEGYGVGTPAGWFPNGVDLDYFAPGAAPYDPEAIVFVGRMDYFPNQRGMLDFCANVLPRIRAQRPGARLAIVGANPSRAVRDLANLPGVTVTGTVADVRPFLAGAAVAVAPLEIARGTQNKILESLAMGVPVVASEVAARGVDAVPGEHLLAAGSADDFAAQILRLMAHPAERRRFAEAGRARAETHHDWQASMRRLDALIDDCLARTAGSAAPARAMA